MSDLHDTIAEVLVSVFGPEARGLAEDDGPGAIEAWDSFSHLNLILALEAAFGVEFGISEVSELVTVGSIRRRLEQAV